jgi:acetolactate synthase-1/2/3 large subunit
VLHERDRAREARDRRAGDRERPRRESRSHLFRALDAELSDDAIVVADGGDFVATASYHAAARAGRCRGSTPACSERSASAAASRSARGWRGRKPSSSCSYGDGSLGYSLMELDTFARHGLGMVAIVGNDASWAQIAREQVEVLKDDVGTVLAPTAYHRAAEGLGATGFEADTLPQALDAVRAAREVARQGRPALVNVRLGRSEFRKGSISM